MVNGISNSINAPVKITNVFTFSVAVDTLFIKANIPINAKRGTAIAVNAKTPPKADLVCFPIGLRIYNISAIEPINAINDPILAIIDVVSIFDNKYITPVNTKTTPVIAISDPTEDLAEPATFVITANMPINNERAATDIISFLVSIRDKAATAATMTPIATVMTIRFPLQSLAPLVATIIRAIIAPSIPTATIPLASPLRSIRLNTIETPANIPIAIDNANIVPAAL